MAAALRDADKLSRIGKVEALKESIRAEFTEEEQAAWEREIPVALKKLEKKAMRTMVVETGERVDGRAADEIRPIMVKDNYLPLVHGSGLFQRGQTQVLSVLSLGMLNEGQRLDTIEPTEGKRYMHHYNFPPFCTGEMCIRDSNKSALFELNDVDVVAFLIDATKPIGRGDAWVAERVRCARCKKVLVLSLIHI